MSRVVSWKFYTVEQDGKRYRVALRVRGVQGAAEQLGVDPKQVTNGADSRLPEWFSREREGGAQ